MKLEYDVSQGNKLLMFRFVLNEEVLGGDIQGRLIWSSELYRTLLYKGRLVVRSIFLLTLSIFSSLVNNL